MLSALHLLRHGDVANPAGVVYANLPGFGLSATGRAQADAAATHLVPLGVDMIITSPLERAVETARAVAAASGVPFSTDARLSEWRLATRWAGTAWADLPRRFPGERDRYLDTPTDLPFSPESITDTARRMMQVVTELAASHRGAAVVLVSHQDPLQALRLTLLGRSLDELHVDKPRHAEVITLTPAGAGWVERSRWVPPQTSAAFPPVKGS